MVIPVRVTSSTEAPCYLFITTRFISGCRRKQLIFETYPPTHFQTSQRSKLVSSLCAMLLRKLTHVHHRSGTFAFQAYFSSDLFFPLKGEALWCPSNLIMAGAQYQQRLISFGFAVVERKWERLNPCGAKSKWIWPVTRGTLWNAQRQQPHSIMEAYLV